MKNQDEQIDKLFQNGLNNYEETPSSSAWDAIDSQLPKNNTRSIYWVAASVAAILLTSTVVWNYILEKTTTTSYEIANSSVEANYPQKEFTPLPILIHTNTVVYIEREVFIQAPETPTQMEPTVAANTSLTSSFELKPISDYYALSSTISETSSKATSFIKEVGEGERPLIDFGKISSGVIARRETINNSNN